MQTPLHLLRVTLQSVRDAVVIVDHDARVQTLNLAAEAMTGWSEAEAIGKPVETVVELREPASDSLLANPVYSAQPAGVHSQALLIGRGGRRVAVEISSTPVFHDNGAPLGTVLVFHNITEAQQLADRIAYQAHHDPLTGLPNRILLVDRMEQATKLADRQSDQLAVLFVCVEVLGATPTRAQADKLSREVAVRLTAHLRESDTVSRLSGSEFVLLLSGLKSRPDIDALATKLVTELTRTYTLDETGNSLTAICSLGISLYPQDASDAGTLMSLADSAMHQAKRAGVNRHIFAKSPVEA